MQFVYSSTLDRSSAARVAFIDDYDLHVAHFLVQGCEVWLNNPRQTARGERNAAAEKPRSTACRI